MPEEEQENKYQGVYIVAGRKEVTKEDLRLLRYVRTRIARQATKIHIQNEEVNDGDEL